MDPQIKQLAEEAYERGGEYYYRGFYENALIEINEALRFDPFCIKYLYSRMIIYDKLDKLFSAILDAGTVAQLDKNCVWAYEFMGYAHSEMGDFGSSKIFYEQALRLQPYNTFYAAEVRLAEKKYKATICATSFNEKVKYVGGINNPTRMKFTHHTAIITSAAEADVPGPSTANN